MSDQHLEVCGGEEADDVSDEEEDRDVGDGLAQHHLEEVLGALTPGRHQYSLVLTNVHSCAC